MHVLLFFNAMKNILVRWGAMWKYWWELSHSDILSSLNIINHCFTCLNIIANRWVAAGSCTTSYKYPRIPRRKSGVGAATKSTIFHNRGFPSHTIPGCWALIGHCSVTWPRHELSLAAEPRPAAARQPVVKFEIFNTLFLLLPLLHAGF